MWFGTEKDRMKLHLGHPDSQAFMFLPAKLLSIKHDSAFRPCSCSMLLGVKRLDDCKHSLSSN
jgi:hypothetical protein